VGLVGVAVARAVVSVAVIERRTGIPAHRPKSENVPESGRDILSTDEPFVQAWIMLTITSKASPASAHISKLMAVHAFVKGEGSSCFVHSPGDRHPFIPCNFLKSAKDISSPIGSAEAYP
jgi:hypothetical protein